MTGARRSRAGALLVLLAGCTLLPTSTAQQVRYFSPEPARALERSAAADRDAGLTADPPAARLQLGQLTASANLRDRIVHRESAVEVGVYDTLRWTEYPDAYVHRALVRALFQERPIEHVLAGAWPVLDVELVAFEVLHEDKGWAGRVELRYHLRDERAVLATGDVAVLRPAGEAGFDGAVAAVGRAMDAASEKLASEVAARLPAPSP